VSVPLDAVASDLDAADFDALLVPGGYSLDHLSIEPNVVGSVRRFLATGKLVAAVRHGPQLLIEVDAVRGRTVR
jgi:protease I